MEEEEEEDEDVEDKDETWRAGITSRYSLTWR